MKTAFIICGALGHEVLAIVARHGWDVDVRAVPALNHVHIERIAPDVERRIMALRERYERLLVVFGDCGTGGKLDELLAHHGIERVAGPHCYEMYAGTVGFEGLLAEELGSYFLTDYLVRGFKGTILKGMGLDRYPELREMYFQNYKRVVYLGQNLTPELLARAQAAADYLGLPLVVRETGYGALEERLVAWMALEGAVVYTKRAEASLGEMPAFPSRRPQKKRRRRRS